MRFIGLYNVRERSLGVRAAVLVAALTAVWLMLVPLAGHFCGPRAPAAAAVAGLACLVGFALALVAGEPARRGGRILHGMLLGMVFRMGAPLAAAVITHAWADGLAHAGFLYWLVIFFEIGLLVEVHLSLPPRSCGKAPAIPSTTPAHPANEPGMR